MNDLIQDIMDKKGAPILVGVFAFLFVMESVSQLRARKGKRTRRMMINAMVSVPGFLALRLLLLPAMVWIAYKNQEWQIGANYLYTFSPWVEGVIAFFLLDLQPFFFCSFTYFGWFTFFLFL